LLLIIGVVLTTAACHKKHPARVSAPTPPKVGASETGVASWYGHPYHGRQAANGETYDMETMVAAHRTLPFDTWVRVRNLNNGKEIEVRIIDRGPFVGGRVIDLSHAAAKAIDLVGPGTAPVRIEIVRVPAAPPGLYGVQVGAYRDRHNAERVRERMAAQYGTAKLMTRQGDTPLWRVVVGAESSETGATSLADQIRRESGETNAFVLRLN
jgi:rare lipoprotein A